MSLYIPPRPAVKAAPQGPGAGVLLSEFPLSTITGQQSPQAKMRRAWQLGISVPWIRAAERVIAGACSTVEWHLEDTEDVEIDDAYGDQWAQLARLVLEKPCAALPEGMQQTRRELWAVTFRHMGLCGNAFWYLDQINVYGIPTAIKYLRPDRMTPVEDDAGNLTAWEIDRTAQKPGIRVPLNVIIHFKLDPPDVGHFGIGLVESAILKAQNSQGLDQHLAQVLASGGRLAGLVSPKQGDSMSDTQYAQLVQDARTVVEVPDAAKRLQIVRGPIEFTQTTMTLADLQLVETMSKARDDVLALWGVPLSQIGGASPAGLNSGDTRKYDEAALWQNANHPRIVSFTESVQYQLLDRWTVLGTTVELEIDEPEFDDDSPRYDLLGKSMNTPLRNWERREIIGLEPFGPEVINPLTGLPVDDEVWLPSTQVQAFIASDEEPVDLGLDFATEEDFADASDMAGEAAGETPELKAGPKFVFGRPNPNYTKGPAKEAYREGASREQIRSELASIEARARAKGLHPTRQQIIDTYNRNLARRTKGKKKRRAPARNSRDNVRTEVTFSGPRSYARGKADLGSLHTALTELRARMDREQTPGLRSSVSQVLHEQRSEIAQRIRASIDHVMRKPGDASPWWDGAKWDTRLLGALKPALVGMATAVDVQVQTQLRQAQKAGPVTAVTHALTQGATRITAVNGRTRDAVTQIVRRAVANGIADGKSPAEVADDIEAGLNEATLDNNVIAFDEYRAELIARTELMASYNDATLGSYRDADVTEVQAIDGDKDEECAARNGRTFSLADAEGISDHPNGTLDWIPVLPAIEVAA